MEYETILAADIGGTNTRLLLFEICVDDASILGPVPHGCLPPGKLLFGEKYQNENFESFVHCVRTFFKSAAINKPPLAACLAVAGPVKDNAVRFTNRLSWSIQGDLLGSELGIKSIRLINDFLAVGYGLLTLDEDNECITLQSAPKQSAAPIACIGAGTGLGECFLTPTADGEYNCFPSEGGHSEYAPRNDLETAMLCYLKDKFAQRHRVSVERVVSGTGLANVYEFLATYKPDQINPHVHSLIEAAGDMKGGVIATNQDNCRLCKLTMEIFTTAYGAEAGVAALKWLPFGGLYLTGGLTPKNMALISKPDGPFMPAFLDKGRVSGMLKDVPVYACKVENLGERGAHLVAFKDFQSVWKQLNSTSMLSALANPMNSGDVGLPLDGGTMISGGMPAALSSASLQNLQVEANGMNGLSPVLSPGMSPNGMQNGMNGGLNGMQPGLVGPGGAPMSSMTSMSSVQSMNGISSKISSGKLLASTSEKDLILQAMGAGGASSNNLVHSGSSKDMLALGQQNSSSSSGNLQSLQGGVGINPLNPVGSASTNNLRRETMDTLTAIPEVDYESMSVASSVRSSVRSFIPGYNDRYASYEKKMAQVGYDHGYGYDHTPSQSGGNSPRNEVKSSSGKSAGHSASASQKDRSSRPGAWQSRASANGEQYGYYDRIDSTASLHSLAVPIQQATPTTTPTPPAPAQFPVPIAASLILGTSLIAAAAIIAVRPNK